MVVELCEAVDERSGRRRAESDEGRNTTEEKEGYEGKRTKENQRKKKPKADGSGHTFVWWACWTVVFFSNVLSFNMYFSYGFFVR